MKADVNVLNSIRQKLSPIGAVYQGHPVLKRSAAYSILMNLPMAALTGMCHELNTNVQGLMDLLEDWDVISVPRNKVGRKAKREAVKLWDEPRIDTD